jgi:hypothetical protein
MLGKEQRKVRPNLLAPSEEKLKKELRSCIRREVGRCLDPEGNGVNPGGGNGGGPSPPGRVQDKQLTTSRGGGNILMEQQGRREEESGVTKRTRHAQST